MKAATDLMLKEGWKPVGYAVLAALLLALFDLELFALIALGGAGLLLWVYRQPQRSVRHFEKGSVTSPCDGKISAITTAADGSVTVEIVTGCLDASLLTMPFEGTIVSCALTRGARLGRKSPLFGRLNERAELRFENTEGRSIALTQTLLQTPAALVLDEPSVRKRRLRGERFGVLTRGITRIHLPASTRVAVNQGESVLATQSLLGYIK